MKRFDIHLRGVLCAPRFHQFSVQIVVNKRELLLPFLNLLVCARVRRVQHFHMQVILAFIGLSEPNNFFHQPIPQFKMEMNRRRENQRKQQKKHTHRIEN